jgi:SSS family solute:Na+ symporter
VKDLLIYITTFAAVIIIPIQLGGWAKIFAAVPPEKLLLAVPQGQTTGAYGVYATLALGSAFALLLYPHTMTAILSATSGHTVRRNAALLPAYTFVLGLLALLGFFALAAGVDKVPEFAEGFRQFKNNFAVPALFLHSFPSWFVGVAFAAIAIGALVPAAIMSIAAANLFTRNIYREFIAPNCEPRKESMVAKTTSLVVKVGALVFIMTLPKEFAINLQLLGGVWIIQTFPSVIFGLYTRWLDPKALLLGWASGMGMGTWMAASLQFKSQIFPLVIFGTTIPAYIAVHSFLLNMIVTVVLTMAFNMSKRSHADETMPGDFVIEAVVEVGLVATCA